MKEISEIIDRLDSWICNNGYAGWDPYDIKGISLFLNLQKPGPGFVSKSLYKFASLGVNHFPLTARKLLRVKPLVNAKAMGLLLAAYVNLYELTGEGCYLDKAKTYARWLEENRGRKYRGYNWGYPFDWQSVAFIPKGTPSAVVTAAVGDGFYLLYKATKDREYLRVCEGICEFITNDLLRSVDLPDRICFSYFPIYDSQVHNANLFAGEFVNRIGTETKRTEWIETGIKCGNFAISEQQEEGFLPYTGLAQLKLHSDGRMVTDHYHSGFEIRMLYNLWKHTSLDRFRRAYQKYYSWYLKNMFTRVHIPKINAKRLYPVNIHACSEAILCTASLLPDHPEQRDNLLKTVEWVVRKMEHKPGTYTYMIKRLPILGKWTLKIPMIRWGQAWMLRALSQAALALK